MSVKDYDLRACNTPACKESLTRRVITVETILGGPIEVSRCMTCDTMPCPKCTGRTMDPTAQVCVHGGCKARIAIEMKPSDGVSE